MTQKILLLGDSGQLAYELKRVLPFVGEVRSVGRATLNYLDFSELEMFVNAYRPQWIVNASAYNFVDLAEDQEKEAFLVNALLPAKLGTLAAQVNARLIHYSTDYVFSGTGTKPYSETDLQSPQTVYGRSKLEGENGIVKVGGDYLIFRVAWLYGHYGKNFYKKIIELAQTKDVLRVVSDQIGCPTSARMVASLTLVAMFQCRYDFGQYRGIYHLVAGGQGSWYDFAKLIVEKSVKEENRTVKDVIPVNSGEFVSRAKRPQYSVLSTKKFQEAFGVCIPDWQNVFMQHVEESEQVISKIDQR